MLFSVSPADLNVLFSWSFSHKVIFNYCSMYVVTKNFDQAEDLCKRTLGPLICLVADHLGRSHELPRKKTDLNKR